MTKRQVEELLRHESFLRALARRLLRDAARADDVVQEAWLVALRSNKRLEEVRRGWLAGIVRNLVRRARRDDERRTRRERTVARDLTTPSTDDLFAEQSFRRRIAQLVVDLPDHYREVVLLRYYDNLTPLLIARRLALPASTVRTRLQRGLNRLRGRLEDGDNGRRVHGSLGLLAAVAFPRRATDVAFRVKVPAAALLLGFGALVLWRQPTALEREHERTSVAARRAIATAPADAPVSVPGTEASRGSAGTTRELLRGIVRLPSGVTSTRVSLTTLSQKQRAGTIVEAGRFFELALDGPSWPLAVTAEHPETEAKTVVVNARQTEPVEIVLHRRALVPDELLQPVSPARAAWGQWLATAVAPPAQPGETMRLVVTGSAVHLQGVVWLPEDAAPDPVAVDVSEPTGWSFRRLVPGNRRFSIPVDWFLGNPLPRTLRVQASRTDMLPSKIDLPVLVNTTGAPSLDFFELMLEPAQTLTGTVQLENAGGADGATVVLFGVEDGTPVTTPFAATTTDGDGRFELAAVPARHYYLVAAVEGYAPTGVLTGGAQEIALVLRRGVAITGAVAGAGAGLSIRATHAGPDEQVLILQEREISLRWRAAGVAWQEVSTRTDAEGHYVLAGLEEAPFDIALVDTDQEQRVSAPGTADFAGAPARVSLEVRAAGMPVVAQVVLARGDEITRLETDADGRLALDVVPVHHEIAVSAPGTVAETKLVRPPAHLVLDLASDASRGTLVITPRGPAAPAACDFGLLLADAGSATAKKTLRLENGRYTWWQVEPGAYVLWALPDGDWLPASKKITVAAGAIASCDVPFERGGRIALDLRAPDDACVADASIWVAGNGSSAPRAALAGVAAPPARTADGLWLSEPLPPGHHVVAIEPWDEELASSLVTVEVTAGNTTRTRVVLAQR